jgi:hypothetical protein
MASRGARVFVAALLGGIGCDVVLDIPQTQVVTPPVPSDDAVTDGAPSEGASDAPAFCTDAPLEAGAPGGWILFDRVDPASHTRHAYVMRPLPCSPAVRVTRMPDTFEEAEPVVSPDGRTLAFVSPDAAGRQIWTLDLTIADAAPRVRTHLTLEDASHPTWSPNGMLVAYAGTNTGISYTAPFDANGMTSPAATRNETGTRTLATPVFVDDTRLVASWGDGLTEIAPVAAFMHPMANDVLGACMMHGVDLAATAVNGAVAYVARAGAGAGAGDAYFIGLFDVKAPACPAAHAYAVDGPLTHAALGPGGVAVAAYGPGAPGGPGLVLLTPTTRTRLTADAGDDHPTWAPATYALAP